jgi:DHA1 family inner membrane transport protein
MPPALIALALGAFGIGTTEFVIAGLLPEVAGSFDVSIPTAGLLISGYAIGVAIGAPLLTAAATRCARKSVLLGLLAIFVAGNLISAVAPTFALLMAGRVLASLSHGAYFGIGSVVAASLVAPQRRASAIALMFTGLTAANVIGVPFGTLLGQHFGWRSTFWVVTVLGAIAFAGIVALVPRQPADPDADVRRELAVFRRGPVWLALGMTALSFGGVFAAFTFIAPMMTQLAGFPDGAVTWLLLLFGGGLVAGNLVGGRLADRALMRSIYGILGSLVAVLVLFAFTAHSRLGSILTIPLLGFVGFAMVPALQSRMMVQAQGAPTLASAANIGAFNVGNAVGAWLAGKSIDAGFGYAAPNWVGAALVAGGLTVAVVSGRAERRSARRSDHQAPTHEYHPPVARLARSERCAVEALAAAWRGTGDPKLRPSSAT